MGLLVSPISLQWRLQAGRSLHANVAGIAQEGSSARAAVCPLEPKLEPKYISVSTYIYTCTYTLVLQVFVHFHKTLHLHRNTGHLAF